MTDHTAPSFERLRVLLVHNRYQQPGGEDAVYEAEAALLAARGHAVTRYEVHNDAVEGLSRPVLAAKAVWNRETTRALGALVQEHRPHVVHVHNTTPLVSPSVYYAARRGGAAVVQTLHNYRLVCPGALLYRDGAPCTDCVGKAFAWPCVRHACYRGSRAATAVVAATTAIHRALGTWARAVDRFVALSPFAREQFVAGGLPARKVVVKPNFLADDPGAGTGGGGALFVGRLSPEKGIRTLLAAWADLPDVPLTICGDGPLAPEVEAAARRQPQVTWLGYRSRAAVLEAMRAADLLVFPSEVFEGMPLAIVEAFAAGLPVVASDRGAMADMVEDGVTGLRFRPADPVALADAVRRALADPSGLAAMRRAARDAFEADYTAEAGYRGLLAVYRDALRERHGLAVPDFSDRSALAAVPA